MDRVFVPGWIAAMNLAKMMTMARNAAAPWAVAAVVRIASAAAASAATG
jgi:hypothetical protein